VTDRTMRVKNGIGERVGVCALSLTFPYAKCGSFDYAPERRGYAQDDRVNYVAPNPKLNPLRLHRRLKTHAGVSAGGLQAEAVFT
jgi:hypothetical protein